jgi:arylsulfatase
MDTHDPYLVPGDYRTQSRRAMYHANYRLWRQGHEPPFSEKTHDRLVRAYDDSIEYADAFLGRLQGDLAGDEPLIAVHGDHGEAFGEHGTYGHHQQLYEENVHVPFVIDGWDDVTVDSPFGLRRMPELLTTMGVEERLPDFDAATVPAQTLDEDRVAIRGRGWKYLRYETETALYDLEDGENTESTDDDLREMGQRLTGRFDEHLDEQERIVSAAGQLGGADL